MKTEPSGHPGGGKTTPFTDFAGLQNYLPVYSERSLRAAIRKGLIPSIVLPGGRKRVFHLPTVDATLRRLQTGGGE